MSNFRKEYSKLKQEAVEQDARLPLTEVERKAQRRAELQRQLKGLEQTAISLCADIENAWRLHVTQIKVAGFRFMPVVHSREERLRAILARCNELREEIMKL